jgi:hypothetical protein
MQQKKWFPVSIYVFIIIGLVFMGCCKKPAQTVSMGKGQTTEQEMAARRLAAGTADVKTAEAGLPAGGQAMSGRSAADKKAGTTTYAGKKRVLPNFYVVKRGDSLWWIAKYKDIYNDPMLWPLLYEANKKVIKNPNRIYPGLRLQIPRTGYTLADIRTARQKAGARKPYNPPARAVPPMD